MERDLPIPVLDALPLGAHRLLCLTDDALYNACGVRIAFTGREGGVSQGCYASLNTGMHVQDHPEAVERNRFLVADAVGSDVAHMVIPNQVHGTNVVEVRSADEVGAALSIAQSGADAVAVGTAGVCALLNFADCLPLVIVSPTGNFVVAHAGWRGALAGMAGKAVEALVSIDEDCDAEAQIAGKVLAAGYNAYIGPHICSECYEVSKEMVDDFTAEFGAGVSPIPDHVDLAFAVTVDLERSGLVRERIVDACVCTACNPQRYFSYRASGGTCGRHAAIAYRER